MEDENSRHIVRVYVGQLSQDYEALSVEASKHTTAGEIVQCITDRLGFENFGDYELAEVFGDFGALGLECKERRIQSTESPVALKLLWPKQTESVSPRSSNRQHVYQVDLENHQHLFPHQNVEQYRFCLRAKDKDQVDSFSSNKFNIMDPQILRDYFNKFLSPPKDREYPDLCQLTDLNEATLLENLRARFNAGHIYTYVGSILIAVNPFKFHPIYNPKYVKLYQNTRREDLPPHIFSIADSAYQKMLKERKNQCVVISGESGSGKTESTNFLLHHLTALSQKGSHGSGVEQIILSAGPVLEAYANAKTQHNNNSSRFGKFIQVSYRENGMVLGAIVQKYLLEKSRICCQAQRERNYHVFYYLLAGASDLEREALCLLPPNQYHYLNQSGCYTLEGVDESYEFSRLKGSMEMVGFGAEKQRKIFCVLSSVLLLGNVEFVPKKSSYHHDESVSLKNPAVVQKISSLLKVTEESLQQALTSKRAKVSGEMLVINYKMQEAIAARNAMAKCLYGALFDWIVLQVNHALLSKNPSKDPSGVESSWSIGVLDIFGFEDFENSNSFEQFCINYANEHLQYYFNLHVFKFEQEEYKKEKIKWTNIEFSDNTPCLNLFEAKPNGLICILDDQCNFPGADSTTLQQKFNSVHKENEFYEIPQKRDEAFIIRHYAGRVKYQVSEFREKNMDLTRNDIISVLKNSSLAFIKELFGIDPVAVFRWAILRAFFRAYASFSKAGQRRRLAKAKASLSRAMSSPGRRRSSGNEHLVNDGEVDDIDEEITQLQMEKIEQRGVVKYRPIRRSHGKMHNFHSQKIRPYPNVSQNNHYSAAAGLNNKMHLNLNGHSESAAVASRCQTSRNNININNNNNNLLDEFCGVNRRVNSQLCCSNLVNSHQHSNSNSNHSTAPAPASYYHYNTKNRSFRSQLTNPRGMKNLQSIKTLSGISSTLGVQNKSYYFNRKQPTSVSTQFQQSLHSLMITLNQANPFFIRCVKSNSDKIPNYFDDELVQRQLRYTGMLETVRIRQAGYNVRVVFEEFVHLYRILLPKGLQSDRKDIVKFLSSIRLNSQNFQIGENKIFLRESEKIKLDYILHHKILDSIITIQRWYRSILDRRHFLHVHQSIIKIQSYVRMLVAQRRVATLRMKNLAATQIQKVWRAHRVRVWFLNTRAILVKLQARIRGNQIRLKTKLPIDDIKRKFTKIPNKELIRLRGDGDSHSGQSTDEAFISKGSSQEELDEHHHKIHKHSEKTTRENDSSDDDESSGVHEESDENVPSSSAPPPVPVRRSFPSRNLGGQQKPISALSEAIFTSTPFTLAGNFTGSQFSTTTPLTSASTDYSNFSPKGSSSQGSPIVPQKGERKIKKKELLNNGKNKSSSLVTKSTTDSHKNIDDDLVDDDLKYVDEYGNITNKSPFQRATKHIKNIIIGGSGKKLTKEEGSELLDSESEEDKTMTNSSDTTARAANFHSPGDYLKYSLDESSLALSPSKAQGLNLRPTRSLQPSFTTTSSSSKEVDEKSTSAGGPPEKLLSERRKIIENTRPRISTSSFASIDSEESFISKSNPTIDVLHGQGRKPSIAAASSSQSVDVVSSTASSKKYPKRGISGGDSVRRTRSQQSSSSLEILSEKKKALYHNWEKVTRFHRGDACDACKKNMHTLFAPGVKCFLCKLFFHSKCIQNGVVGDCPGVGGSTSENKIVSVRKKYHRKPTSKSTESSKEPGRFSLTGTSEFIDRTDQIISGVKELQLMQEFISKKIYQLKINEGEKENVVDRVFQEALKEFKENLVSTFSVASKSSTPLSIKYKDLIANFANIIENVCKSQGRGEDFPKTMGINAFRGFLNEFMNAHRNEEKPKVSKGRRGKDKSEKRAKIEEVLHLGHRFVTMVINIPTACEVCSSFIMWPIERGLVCQKCKLACHKKCHLKILSGCNQEGARRSTSGSESGIFGSPLCSLVPDGATVPVVVDQLVTAIELFGLRQEGIYRKSGVSSRVRELKNELEDGKQIDWETYPVHCVTSVLKSFFRELPEPLLTYELYDEFLRAADLSQAEDRIHTIFSILKKLPKTNYDLMERLVFHLVRVASYEDKNRMNCNSLSIVFAPCILRTNKVIQVQDSLSDISRQTQCIETILSEQLKKVKATLINIESIDSETHSFSVRLNSIRSSKIKTSPSRKSISGISIGGSIDDDANIIHEGQHEKPFDSSTPDNMSTEEEEEYLTRHLKHLQDEKEILTSVLPSLSRTPSDEDLLSTDEIDSPGGSNDDIRLTKGSSPSPRQSRAKSLQYSKTESLAVASKLGTSRLSPNLTRNALLVNPAIIKNRGPIRKPPSRFVRNLGAVDFGEGDIEYHDEFDEVKIPIHRNLNLNPTTEDSSILSVESNTEDEEPIIV